MCVLSSFREFFGNRGRAPRLLDRQIRFFSKSQAFSRRFAFCFFASRIEWLVRGFHRVGSILHFEEFYIVLECQLLCQIVIVIYIIHHLKFMDKDGFDLYLDFKFPFVYIFHLLKQTQQINLNDVLQYLHNFFQNFFNQIKNHLR